MWLRLTPYGFDFQLKITDYRPGTDAASPAPCDVECYAGAFFLDYTTGGGLLRSHEVDALLTSVEALLSGGNPNDWECAEPELAFAFHPTFKGISPAMEWIIIPWNGRGLSLNTIHVVLGPSELRALAVYLRLVTGQLDEQDELVVHLVEKEVLLPEDARPERGSYR